MLKLNVGLVSVGQKSFPGDKTEQYSKSIEQLEKRKNETGFDLFVYRDTVISEYDAEKAVKIMEEAKVDLLLVQCTSFAGGFLAPVLAGIKNAWLGLWAIPEGADEGAVPFNSFCCVNMYSSIIGHYLKDNHIKFKWFYGNAGHPLFDGRFEVTVKALTAIKNMRNSKVALIGGVAPGFNDLYFDERNVLKRFRGLKINRLHEFSEIRDRAIKYETSDLIPVMEEMIGESAGIHEKSKSLIEVNARFYKAYKDFVQEYGYDGLAVSCWPKFQDEFRFSVCSVVAKLNDEGIVTACEGDLPSALSMLLLKYLTKDETMLMDFSDFDEADETILMWHCGPASKKFADHNGFTLGVNYHGLPHDKKGELNCCGVVRDMVFKPGHVTIARFTGECDRIFLAEGNFINRGKKSFFGSRGWLESLKLNADYIAVRDFVNTVLVQRFQHHYPIVGGNLSREIIEIAAWLDMSLVEKVPYQDYLQNCEEK